MTITAKLDKLRRHHAAELERLERELKLAELAPVEPDRVHDFNPAPWYCYDVEDLAAAFDVLRAFKVTPYTVREDGGLIYAQPEPLYSPSQLVTTKLRGSFEVSLRHNAGPGFSAFEVSAFALVPAAGRGIVRVLAKLRRPPRAATWARLRKIKGSRGTVERIELALPDPTVFRYDDVTRYGAGGERSFDVAYRFKHLATAEERIIAAEFRQQQINREAQK